MKAFNIGHLRSWYVFCIMWCTSGCFFWLPLEEKHPNVPPVIEFSSPEADGIVRVDTVSGSVAWVSVYDKDEDDALEYLWTISGLGPQGTAQAFVNNNYQGSSIQVLPDTVYDGRVLTCTVYDSVGASDRRSWSIEIGEGF